jgi:hypothetical protein
LVSSFLPDFVLLLFVVETFSFLLCFYFSHNLYSH